MTLAPDEVDAILAGGDGETALDVLGPHLLPSGALRIVVFQPGAERIVVRPDDGPRKPLPMERVREEGIFEVIYTDAKQSFAYVLEVEIRGSQTERRDPYSYSPLISDLDLFTIGQGTNAQAYEVLGAHLRRIDGVEGVHFAVWAPHARRLSVIGDFNNWHTRQHPCRRRGDGGIWELFIPGVPAGACYKFHIESELSNYVVDKADPYAFTAEVRPRTASIVADISHFEWQDQQWIDERAQSTTLDRPILIYEVHAASWRRAPDGRELNYRELAQQLVDYVKSMGFTHIELMPITEHPFDVSWGYQTTGYFAPTSRFGSPADFAYFVDHCHRNGIGVLLDWVPSHFAKEGHGLGFFDGAHLYEHADPRQGEHFDWGTYVFNYGRGEVMTFLLSNAMFWLGQYHIDGLRLDAVASMLYLDHQRPAGAWVPNKFGGRENLEAIEFLRRFNVLVHDRFPGVLTMAEESTSWPMVSRPVYVGGLGFTLKWNMGWMHDTLEYIKADPIHRRHLHNSITFSILYHYSENFLLPLSHDEVVHGKSPLVFKAPGDDWRKFATLRLLFGYMWAHPGKKLLFMGGEFAQTYEWNYAAALHWELLQFEAHQSMQQWMRDLNQLYLNNPEFFELDHDPAGFEWIDCRDVDQSILIMMRKGRANQLLESELSELMADEQLQKESRSLDIPYSSLEYDEQKRRIAWEIEYSRPFTIVACNFTPVVRHGYVIGMPRPGKYCEVVNSDSTRYGGSNVVNEGVFETQWRRMHGRDYSIAITLPPLGVSVLKLMPE
jgi:1,4-alpha-glucan branching enzyme